MNFDFDSLFNKAITKEKKNQIVEELQTNQPTDPIPLNIQTNISNLKLYDKIAPQVAKQLNLSSDEDGVQMLKQFADNPDKFKEKLENKVFLLDKFNNPKKGTNLNSGKTKMISGRFKKTHKLFDIPKDKLKFDNFIKMNKLWVEYAIELTQNEKNEENLLNKLLRADYHGARMKVLKAKCKSYEGQSGIVVMETMRTFKMITEDDKFITVLKKDCVFLVELLSRDIKIYGTLFQYRPAERFKAKFKARSFDFFD